MQKPHAHQAANLLLNVIFHNRRGFRIAVLISVVVSLGYGQNGGSGFGLHPADIFSAFHLPAYEDAAGTPLATEFGKLQVGARAKSLGLTGASSLDAWRIGQSVLDRSLSLPPRPRPGKTQIFSGTTGSALNQFIAAAEPGTIQISSAHLILNQPIAIVRRDVALNLGSAIIAAANPQPYMLRVENTSNVTVSGGVFVSGDSAILVNNSSSIDILDTQIDGLSGAGIVVTGSRRVNISNNRISSVGLGGIVVHRGTTLSTIGNNRIESAKGFSNLDAGIVITDREVDIASNPRAIFQSGDYYVIIQNITRRVNPPRDNLVAWNSVSNGLSSGIYSDGGVRNVIFANHLIGNSKEGMCLDNGSTANVVAGNVIYDNGQRWGDPDSILALDFVLDGGRLADGTGAEKVPGISMDNAAYNVVFSNDLAHNFGGGVKMVRTAFFNAVGLNTLLDNNDGAGDKFHFFGIEVGSAPGAATDLDYTPSKGNVLFSNVIRGNHYSGIFFGDGSSGNNVRFNSIFDCTAWALESSPGITNISVNNLTTSPSRNIGSGLDPALVTAGQAVNDPPM